MIRAAFQSLMAASSNSPTRAVEFMLAWLMIGWGVAVAGTNDMLVGPTTKFLLNVFSEPVWAVIALSLGFARLTALVINGAWRRSPLLRFACAAVGLMWWTMFGALYWIAISAGAPPFPNLSIYPVFMFFEAYSCYRCGQDAAAQRSFGDSIPASPDVRLS